MENMRIITKSKRFSRNYCIEHDKFHFNRRLIVIYAFSFGSRKETSLIPYIFVANILCFVFSFASTELEVRVDLIETQLPYFVYVFFLFVAVTFICISTSSNGGKKKTVMILEHAYSFIFSSAKKMLESIRIRKFYTCIKNSQATLKKEHICYSFPFCSDSLSGIPAAQKDCKNSKKVFEIFIILIVITQKKIHSFDFRVHFICIGYIFQPKKKRTIHAKEEMKKKDQKKRSQVVFVLSSYSR